MLLGVGACVAAVVSYLLIHRGPAAVALAAAPIVCVLLLRSYGGLALGLAMILILPYWQTLGSPQIEVLRVASLSAASGLLWARGLRVTPIDWALAVYVAICVVAWLLEFHQPGAGRILSTEMTPLGFYIGARAIHPVRHRLVLLISLIAGTLGALTVIYEYWRGHTVFIAPLSYNWNASTSSIFRPGGIFGSPPEASTVLSLIVFFGVALIVIARGRLRRVAMTCTAVSAVALLLTFTRAGLIAAGVGILLMLWLLHSPLLRPLRIAWFVALLAATAFFLFPALQRSKTVQFGLIRPGELTAREGYWQIALPVATSDAGTFMFGAGTGSLEAPLTHADDRIPANLATRPQLTENSLHSEYVTTLLEQGIIGLGAVIVLLLAGFLPAVRAARAKRDPLAAAIAASILSVAIVMAVDTVFLDSDSFAMLMLVLGLAARRGSWSARNPADARSIAAGSSSAALN